MVVCLAVTGLCASVSSLWGVPWADVLRFVVRLGCAIALACYAVNAAASTGPAR